VRPKKVSPTKPLEIPEPSPVPGPTPHVHREQPQMPEKPTEEQMLIALSRIESSVLADVRNREWELALAHKKDADNLRSMMERFGYEPVNNIRAAEEEIKEHWKDIIAQETKILLDRLVRVERDGFKLLYEGRYPEADANRDEANSIRDLLRDKGVSDEDMPPPREWERARQDQQTAFIADLLKKLRFAEKTAMTLDSQDFREAAYAQWDAAYALRNQLFRFNLSPDELGPNPRPFRRRKTKDPRIETLMDSVVRQENLARTLESEGGDATEIWALAETSRAELRVLGVLDWDQPPKPPALEVNMQSETQQNKEREAALKALERSLKANAPLDRSKPPSRALQQAADAYQNAKAETEKIILEEVALTDKIHEIEENENATDVDKVNRTFYVKQRERVQERFRQAEKRGKKALQYLTDEGGQYLVMTEREKEEERQQMEIFNKTMEWL
jgi:hypothetical protein